MADHRKRGNRSRRRGRGKRRDVYSLLTEKEKRHLRVAGGCSSAATVKDTLRKALALSDEWHARPAEEECVPFPGCHQCVSIARKVHEAGLL